MFQRRSAILSIANNASSESAHTLYAKYRNFCGRLRHNTICSHRCFDLPFISKNFCAVYFVIENHNRAQKIHLGTSHAGEAKLAGTKFLTNWFTQDLLQKRHRSLGPLFEKSFDTVKFEIIFKIKIRKWRSQTESDT